MAVENDSTVTEFILVGFTDLTQLQLPLFLLFLMNYMVTVVGNLSLINLIYLNAHLHTPMYFFIFNLSFIDLCHSLVITPKLLMSFVSENTISFEGCMAQLFFFCFFVIVVSILPIVLWLFTCVLLIFVKFFRVWIYVSSISCVLYMVCNTYLLSK